MLYIWNYYKIIQNVSYNWKNNNLKKKKTVLSGKESYSSLNRLSQTKGPPREALLPFSEPWSGTCLQPRWTMLQWHEDPKSYWSLHAQIQVTSIKMKTMAPGVIATTSSSVFCRRCCRKSPSLSFGAAWLLPATDWHFAGNTHHQETK